MAKDTSRSSRYSRMRNTQIGIDSYSKGQELPTQRVHHAGLVSIGRHSDQFARKRYAVIQANTSNNIPYESLRIQDLHETAYDETIFDGYGFNPFHTKDYYVASLIDNTKENTVFRSEAIFDSVFYKHYKSEHHDRGSVYLEKEDVSMSSFSILDYMSGSKYYDLAFDENIYSYRTGLQEEWLRELVARQTFNLRQHHPMSATTGLESDVIRTDYAGEIRNSNIRECYFEDWPTILSYEISAQKTDADYLRAVNSVLNEEVFFEENDISINPLIDDSIGIPNKHDPQIMNLLYKFEKESFRHSSIPLRIFFPVNNENNPLMSKSSTNQHPQQDFGTFDSSVIIDQSDSSNHGRPLSLFLNDGVYYDEEFYANNNISFNNVPGSHHSQPDNIKFYTGQYTVQYEIDGSIVTRASYFSSVESGSYSNALIKLDRDFSGILVLFTSSFPKQQKLLTVEPYYKFRGQPSNMPLTPFNKYNKRNHINGHSGHIATSLERYDSITFRGLRR